MKFRLFAFAIFLLAAVPSSHAAFLSIDAFDMHGFDSTILKTLGYESGVIQYWSEMATITQSEREKRNTYEPLGCFPFYVVKGGELVEAGYNCRTFFCTGYYKNVTQCRDRAGKSIGGVVEIDRRIGNANSMKGGLPYERILEADRTPAMRERSEAMAKVRCQATWTFEWGDVLVGEGYSCPEVGAYPYFGPEESCISDWRTDTARHCATLPAASVAKREEAIRLRGGGMESAASSSISSAMTNSSVGSLFKDLPNSHRARSAVLRLAEAGVLQGYPDGTFKPSQTVNRAELLKMLVAGLFAGEAKGEDRCFPDVVAQWYSTFVCAAKRLSWIGGYADGMFRPAQTVNRAEALKMILGAAGLTPAVAGNLPNDVQADAWFASYVRAATAAGILDAGLFRPGQELTRGDAAIWIDSATR